jgi:hypothetical protein
LTTTKKIVINRPKINWIMKYIITEEQSLFIRRRYDEIDDLINKFIEETPPRRYSNFDHYFNYIKWLVVDQYFGKMEYDDIKYLNELIHDNYWEKIKEYYLSQTS